jgi:hydrogenase maturation protease
MDRQTPLLVIGVGNWYRGDDAVGLVVARKLRAMHLPGVQVKEESGEGASLMEAWKNAESVIVVDAVSSGSSPGTIHTLDPHVQTIPTDFFHYSSHAFSVAEAIELARALNQLPQRMTVLGVEGENFSAGVDLSTEVGKAVDRVATMITNRASTAVAVH